MDDLAPTANRWLARIACAIGAAVTTLLIGAAHGLLRAEAHAASVLPTVAAGSIENWLIPGHHDAAYWLQRLVPAGVGTAPAVGLWWSFFYVPPLLAALALATLGPRQCLRLLFLYAAVLFAADAIFALLPTMPPWMADGTPRLITQSAGSLTRFDTNPTAAFPSLHVAVPTVMAIWYCRHEQRWCKVLGALLLLRAALVFWAVVYTGEHYLLDGVGGFSLAWSVYWLADRLGLAQDRRPAAARGSPVSEGAPVIDGAEEWEAQRAVA
ncbi:MAG: phosphatase PAP2 family protein [Dehalococcoidia bacterium]|nr:phosphatase PAP2 family protein [Dehalococcoidia bacterium]